MSDNIKLLVIGGGLAGLSTGCYARANGFSVTIVEHNLALGGVCTAWQRGPYLVDGCIHWLTGGPFQHLYEELGILPAVTLRTLDEFATYRHARDRWEVHIARDLRATKDALSALAPEDATELARLFDGIERLRDLTLDVDHPPEFASVGDRLRDFWHMRHGIGTLAHFRKPIGTWIEQDLQNAKVRDVFRRLLPAEMPTFFLAMVLGWLERGWLSRPDGGAARFRDVLVDRYRALGGQALVNTTVEEVVVRDHRAVGVRLTDGTVLDADVIVSTASGPETVFRLLGGRYGAAEWKTRVDQWPTVQPVALVSFGVARTYDDQPSTLILGETHPMVVGDRRNDHLSLRIYNEDPVFAPPGHTVVQAIVPTDYDWWATRGSRYQHEKACMAERVLGYIERYLPGTRDAVRMTDVATPLTFWRTARSWRGAYEGWVPTPDTPRHVPKQLAGLDGFYMAGQWVEPGGGIPLAVMSGRHTAELLCAAFDRPFASPLGIQPARAPRVDAHVPA